MSSKNINQTRRREKRKKCYSNRIRWFGKEVRCFPFVAAATAAFEAAGLERASRHSRWPRLSRVPLWIRMIQIHRRERHAPPRTRAAIGKANIRFWNQKQSGRQLHARFTRRGGKGKHEMIDQSMSSHHAATRLATRHNEQTCGPDATRMTFAAASGMLERAMPLTDMSVSSSRNPALSAGPFGTTRTTRGTAKASDECKRLKRARDPIRCESALVRAF